MMTLARKVSELPQARKEKLFSRLGYKQEWLQGQQCLNEWETMLCMLQDFKDNHCTKELVNILDELKIDYIE